MVRLDLLTIHKALSNEAAFSIYVLNFLWSYVLSLCQLKNVLLSVSTYNTKMIFYHILVKENVHHM